VAQVAALASLRAPAWSWRRDKRHITQEDKLFGVVAPFGLI
jgi:hypothetical protein